MDIEVVIPYSLDGNLGAEYNRIMENIKDWVLFLDHDILILNKHWYRACVDAINRHGHKAGWISCMTNRIYCPDQKCGVDVNNDNICFHIDVANGLWSKHNNKTYPPNSGVPFSGFFILTHKKAWEDAGGFTDGFLGVDNDYYNKITGKGYETYIMPGIYSYHIYNKKSLMSN